MSDGDPAIAFGPRRGADGRFSFANGSRLYYANLTSNFGATRDEASFKGFARALRMACAIDPAAAGLVPSTKGVI